MPDPSEVAAATATAFVVKRVTAPIVETLVGGFRSLLRMTGDGAPDPSRRAASYKQLMEAVACTRSDLALYGGSSADPRGALWTWPVYLSAFWRLPRRNQELMAGLFAVAIDGRGPVLDATVAVGQALSAAFEALPVSARRGKRDAARPAFDDALAKVDETLVNMAMAARQDLGHGNISRSKGRRKPEG
jgi:hypothetical protein